MSDETTMPFDFSNGGTPSIIKVIGVGGNRCRRGRRKRGQPHVQRRNPRRDIRRMQYR